MEKGTFSALSRVAAGQCGLFSAAQAHQLGIQPSSLSRAVAAGRLVRVRKSVYRFPSSPSSPGAEYVAAALGAGPLAALSHSSAAAIHGFEHGLTDVMEIVVSGGRSRIPGVVVHRYPVDPRDLVTYAGVKVTSPAMTLVDLAARLGPSLTARVLDEGLVKRRWTAMKIGSALSRRPLNLPGRGHLVAMLRERAESPGADSMLEARAFRALKPLAPFEVHHVVEVDGKTYVLDAAWPSCRVAVEVDGRSHRVASRDAFDRERRKINALGAAGWRIAHLTSVMSPEEMCAAVRKLFASVHLGSGRPDAPTLNVQYGARRRRG